MLETLQHIVQEVNSARDFSEALQLCVDKVREAVNTQACGIYLFDPSRREYILVAHQGLKANAAGRVRVSCDQGLVSYVGDKGKPINLEDAQAHPNFFYHPEMGEDKYRAYLGAPIIHHRQVLGVLAIQQEDKRLFDDQEEAFLVTISAQLGGVLAYAYSTGKFQKLISDLIGEPTSSAQAALEGEGSVPGVGIGTAVVVYPLADLDAVPDRSTEDVEAEIKQFYQALEAVRDDIQALGKRLAKTLPPEEQALFDVYLRLLDKQSMGEAVEAEIKKGQWAQAALRTVIDQRVKQLESLDDPYLRERSADFRDLGRRLLAYLQANQPKKTAYPERTILVGDEIPASALAEVPEGSLAGVVSFKGSRNAHVAILARALGIPTVMGASGCPLTDLEDRPLVVDGYYGQVFVSPPPLLLKKFEALAAEEQEMDEGLLALRDEPAQTTDTHRVNFYVNTGLAVGAGRALTVGAEGVGLYRTEVPFMVRERFPVEEEQRVIYRQLLQSFAPRPVTMRTLDIGGDKALSYFPVQEDNPFLGWRGIRVTLDHPELFSAQVRAMLRASEGLNNLRLMLPMVTTLSEWQAAKKIIDQTYNDLTQQGLSIEMPAVGIMIEVPGAVYQAKMFAKHADFLSVGSNDLIQYMLAVDRGNPRVAELYDGFHPSVLHALKAIVEGGHAEGKEVSICGELSSNPLSVILLVAMGFDSLSMNSASLLRMKWVVRSFSMKQARKLLHDVLAMDTGKQVRAHLESALCEVGLGGLIRAGKL